MDSFKSNTYDTISYREISSDLKTYIGQEIVVKTVELYYWNKRNNDSIEIDAKLCTLRIKWNSGYLDYRIYARESGFLKTIHKNHTQHFASIIKDGRKIFEIEKPNIGNIYNVPKIANSNLFEPNSNVIWSRVGGNNIDDNILNGFFLTHTDTNERLFITLNNIDTRDYLIINFPAKDISISLEDKFQVLLSSEEMLSFNLTKPYSSHNCGWNSLGRVKGVKIPILYPDIVKLSENEIISWRILKANNAEYSGINSYGYDQLYTNDSNKLIKLMKTFFQDYLKRVSQIEGYKPLYEYLSQPPK